MEVRTMKTRIVMFFVCLLSLLLMGQNLTSKQTALNHHNNSIRNHHSIDLKSLPISKINHQSNSRAWRLSQVLTQYDIEDRQNRELINSDSYYYYYNLTRPARIDSIVRFGWNSNDLLWEYQDTRKYLYDATGEFVSEEQICNTYNYGIDNIIEKTCCYYDNQHRLVEACEYGNFDWEPGAFTYTDHRYFIYENSLLTTINSVYQEEGYDEYLSRSTFTHDAQGRIITGNYYETYDSLNWEIYGADSTAYNAIDTTTGADLISYLAHSYLADSDISNVPVLFGMVSEYKTYEDWQDTYWDEGDKYLFTYNASNQISSVLSQFLEYPDLWFDSSRYNYSYDANNNLNQVTTQYWDLENGVWSSIMEQITYTWDQYTPDEDNIAPGISTSLIACPNPFSYKTAIRFGLKENSAINLSVYNLKGQRVRTLTVGLLQKGSHDIVWDGKSDNGNTLPCGIYIARLQGDGFTLVSKLSLLK
jgi:hypothetical protein